MSEFILKIFDVNNRCISGPLNIRSLNLEINQSNNIGPPYGNIRIEISDSNVNLQPLLERIGSIYQSRILNPSDNRIVDKIKIKDASQNEILIINDAMVTSIQFSDYDFTYTVEINWQFFLNTNLHLESNLVYNFMLEGDWTGYGEESYSDLIGVSNRDWLRFGF